MKVKPVRPRTRWLSLVFVAGFLSVLGISLFAVGFDTKQNKGHDTIKTRLGDIAMEAAKLTGDAHHGEIHLFLYLLYQNEEDRSEVRDWISSLYRRLDRLERLVEDPSLKEILDSVRESAGLLPDIAAGLSDPPDKASGEAAGDAAVGADGFDFAGRVPEVHHAHEVFSAIRDSGTRLSEAALEREAYEQSIAAEKAERRKQQFYMLIAVVFGIVLVLGVLWILAYASLIRETHQRKAAESARATEGEKYKTLFNNMTVGVFYQQADGVLSDVNQAALDMFEVTRPEFIGRFFSDHDWRIVGEDGSECRPSQYPPQVALSTGKAVTDVVLGIQKPGDGEIKWVSITAVPQYRQGEKNPRQAFVTMLDITPRKAFEGALKDSEQKVQHLHDQTEQLSLAAAEMISIPDKERVFQKISDAIVAYSDYQRVIISLFKDTFPYREIVGFAGIEAEKVERIRNIEFKRDWYDKVFEQGIRIGDFSYYIPHTMKHILYQEATYFGEGPVPEHSNVWHPEDNLFVRMNDDQGDFIGVISVDDSKSGEIPSGKTIRPLEIFSSLISQIILFKREQEMRENAEAQLQQAMKMESIGTLAGGIAHDFNNILGIIIGNTELNLEDMPEGDPLRGSLEEILDASLRAADIVRQLLSFSRKSDHLLAPVDIIPVIRDTLNFMRSSIPSTVRITHMIRTKTAVANADPIQINRILMNLCINAYQAMPEKKGKIEVTVDQVDLSPGREVFPDAGEVVSGPHIRVQVKDTGAGIPNDIQDRIFDPYFTTKAVGKGSGMGLSVVVGIVKAHDGHIRVDSSPGQGSCFTILLPVIPDVPEELHEQGAAADTPEETRPHKRITDLAGGSETILFVDDDASMTDTYGKLLTRLGYTVEAFNDPGRALRTFRDAPERFDLVITDMTMPGITGAELSSAVMKTRKDFPVIICTGHSELIDENQALKLGICAYLTKPVARKKLADVIRRVLDGRE